MGLPSPQVFSCQAGAPGGLVLKCLPKSGGLRTGRAGGILNEEFGVRYVIVKIPTRNQVDIRNAQLDLGV